MAASTSRSTAVRTSDDAAPTDIHEYLRKFPRYQKFYRAPRVQDEGFRCVHWPLCTYNTYNAPIHVLREIHRLVYIDIYINIYISIRIYIHTCGLLVVCSTRPTDLLGQFRLSGDVRQVARAPSLLLCTLVVYLLVRRCQEILASCVEAAC